MRCKTAMKHISPSSLLKHIHRHYTPFISMQQNIRLHHAYIQHHRYFSSTIKLSSDIQQLGDDVLTGSRRALSRAITLIESTHPHHYKQGQLLLSYIYQQKQLQANGKPHTSFRIGITGPPGAGKSTFVNYLGTQISDAPYNKKVCVLPIDPSSFLSGGSILGDQTRMLDLFQKESAYVRPSPNRLSLGGVTDTTNEVCALCETAGFDTIFVETVGVGQAEIEVANCVDMFVLVITPTSGDDLQGLKRGIMEMADLIIVNKAEGDMLKQAKHIKHDYQRALGLTHTRRANVGWQPKIVLCSSLPKSAVKKRRNVKDDADDDRHKKEKEYDVLNVWKEIEIFKKEMEEKGELERCRKEQSKHAMWKYVWRNIKSNVENLKPDLCGIESSVMDHDISPREGSQEILKYIWRNGNN